MYCIHPCCGMQRWSENRAYRQGPRIQYVVEDTAVYYYYARYPSICEKYIFRTVTFWRLWMLWPWAERKEMHPLLIQRYLCYRLHDTSGTHPGGSADLASPELSRLRSGVRTAAALPRFPFRELSSSALQVQDPIPRGSSCCHDTGANKWANKCRAHTRPRPRRVFVMVSAASKLLFFPA